MGESITEGTITKWLKAVGDKVDRDEPLFEISTDKVDAGIPSPVAGTLLEIKNQEGETVEVGTVVAFIGAEGGARLRLASGAPKKKRRPRLRKLQNPPSSEGRTRGRDHSPRGSARQTVKHPLKICAKTKSSPLVRTSLRNNVDISKITAAD